MSSATPEAIAKAEQALADARAAQAAKERDEANAIRQGGMDQRLAKINAEIDRVNGVADAPPVVVKSTPPPPAPTINDNESGADSAAKN